MFKLNIIFKIDGSNLTQLVETLQYI